MRRINGYPLWYYLVGVAVVGGTVSLCLAVAGAAGVDGWLGVLVGCAALLIGFALARQVNARLFAADDAS